MMKKQYIIIVTPTPNQLEKLPWAVQIFFRIILDYYINTLWSTNCYSPFYTVYSILVITQSVFPV